MLYEDRVNLSKLRLESAKELLEVSKMNLNNGFYKSAAKRSYYAIFSAMRAVLALDGFDSKKHAGIISEFRKKYIKTGIFDSSLSNIITDLFEARQNSDYNDFYVVFKNDVVEQNKQASFFIVTVERYLNSKY